MGRAGVATAASGSFDDPAAARAYLETMQPPYVVKADGLAAGKGVLVTDSVTEAGGWIDRCFDGEFGEAGSSVLIEEFLDGPEISVFAVCTNKGAVALDPARDYKRLRDGDRGPNTGGMGSYSPVPDLPDDLLARTMSEVVNPTLSQMKEDGNPFTGFLYAGLVLTADALRVLEFNVRLGDPETQAVLPRMSNDLIDVLEGGAPEWSDTAAVNVVLAAKGYPTAPEKGATIKGMANLPDDVLVFHAGTARDGKKLVVDGGRVLSLVGFGPDLASARDRAYAAAETIRWPGMQLRSDIGAQA